MKLTKAGVAVILGTIAFLVASTFTSGAMEPSGRSAHTGAHKVVIFGIPQLALGDVTSGAMPSLARLARTGATAATNIRTKSAQPSPSEAYATLGAGDRIAATPATAAAYDANEPFEGGTAGQVVDRRTGSTSNAGVVIPAMPGQTGAGGHGEVRGAGALGAALARAHLRTAVVSNADQRDLRGAAIRAAPAAQVVATPDGRVDAGTVSPHLLRQDASAPYGIAVDPARFTRAVRVAVHRADVVVVDPGETIRAATYLLQQSPGEAADARRAALRRTDRVLGAVARDLPDDALLIVVGVTPPTAGWPLTPTVAHGAGTTRGQLVSPATHHAGLITMTDIAPTVLDALGVPEPRGMVGSALRYGGGEPGFGAGRQLDHVLASRYATAGPMTVAFVVVQVVLYLIAMAALLVFGTTSRLTRIFELAALSCAAWPLATFWLRVSPRLDSQGGATVALTWAVAVGVAALASRLRKHPLDPLLAICALTVATIVIDLATGAHLQLGSFFGYAPNTATRYSGIGNAAYALLGGATLVVCTALVDRSSRPHDAWWLAAGVAAVVVFADSASWMGADVGGILTMIPVFGLMLWSLSGRPIRRRTLVVSAAGAIVALAGVVAVEAFRPPSDRTHIGRFFLGAGEGNRQLVVSTLRDKWAMNVAGSFNSWTWAVLAVAGFSIYVLVVAKGWRALLPPGSPLRAGMIGALALGVAGWLFNDSGVVVTALVLVYTGPFVLLLALRRAPDPPGSLQFPPLPELPGPVAEETAA